MTLHFEVKNEKIVPLITVKSILSERKKSELTYEQKMALENAQDFTKITKTNQTKMVEDLKALDIRKLTD